jgi:peroxiredoxin
LPLPELPSVPITLEGSCVLHQMFHLDWTAWKKISAEEQQKITNEAAEVLSRWERGAAQGHPNQSAAFSQLGHKGDLMLIHFRDSFADVNRIELEFSQIRLREYLKISHSYLSVVELGLYESSTKTYAALAEKGLQPATPEWDAGIREVTERQSRAMEQRLFPAIPNAKYLCFYPMDRKRGEQVNWYTQPMAERQQMMHEHGIIGRRYADCVRQIITGSIGFDDWEWGVDLFADDPMVFKKLIYEMRFDRVSAVYALFGQFFLGVRLPSANLGLWLRGQLPEP